MNKSVVIVGASGHGREKVVCCVIEMIMKQLCQHRQACLGGKNVYDTWKTFYKHLADPYVFLLLYI